MKTIFQRRSIRKYLQAPVSDEQLEAILRAGMAAPSSGNDQEWVFVVIRKAHTMREIMKMDPYAKALQTAPLCVAVCADMRLVSEPDQLFWVQDLSAASQNMLLEATSLNLGSLWLGLYPAQRTMLRHILSLPKYIEPLMLLAFGVAAVQKDQNDRYLEERVHFEHYQLESV